VREIVLDTETTGLDPSDGHRIIEIGALEMSNKVLTGKKFHHYVNPKREISKEAYRVHGISNDFLRDRPLFGDIAKEFLEFIDGATLVIHNAPFDMKFLNHELSLINIASIDHMKVVDTLIMARRMFPGQRANLDALCRRFRVDNSLRGYHGALKDAELLAAVYVELCGGRQASFTMKSNNNTSRNIDKSVNRQDIGNKITIKPSDQELGLHENLMKKINS
jgi:DNA polymerase-3 subunit epsilon